jgi:hypothetical protein
MKTPSTLTLQQFEEELRHRGFRVENGVVHGLRLKRQKKSGEGKPTAWRRSQSPSGH